MFIKKLFLYSEPPEGFCPVAPSERVECGYYGISKRECVDKQCCWDDTVPNTKWCFKDPSKYRAKHGAFLCSLNLRIQTDSRLIIHLPPTFQTQKQGQSYCESELYSYAVNRYKCERFAASLSRRRLFVYQKMHIFTFALNIKMHLDSSVSPNDSLFTFDILFGKKKISEMPRLSGTRTHVSLFLVRRDI